MYSEIPETLRPSATRQTRLNPEREPWESLSSNVMGEIVQSPLITEPWQRVVHIPQVSGMLGSGNIAANALGER
jgi:hypothetical protein